MVLPNFILIVIDASVGIFCEIISRVVWLDRPGYDQLQDLDEDELITSDTIITQPFHGSRLDRKPKLLLEFGGEILEADPFASSSPPRLIASSLDAISLPLNKTKIREVEKHFSGKKVLLVDDEPSLQRIANDVLSRLGITIEISSNGHEALQTVVKVLEDQRTSKTIYSLSFNNIFKDFQMLVTDGIEATRRIREEEAKYGLHIPIFVVSAYTDGPEIQWMKEAGMDYNLSKPLNVAKLVEFLSSFEV